MKFGLVGKTLSHSYSTLIHEQLDSKPYVLYSLEEKELDCFLKNKDFFGVNVTIPYKEKVIPYLDELDEISNNIHSVNTIVNNNGKLIGYNTDYYGLKELFDSISLDPKDKNCYILGSGGTKNTAYKLLKDLKAKSIKVVSRNKKDDTLTYQEFYQQEDVQIIINTTPVGMYPHIEDEVISIDNFPNLIGVIDVIYNPYQTKLVIKAKEKGIKATGGLKMLVRQGIKASELFLSKKYDEEYFNKIYSSLYYQKMNIVLIGLPMVGKSIVGKKLAKELKKNFVDIDEEIEKEHKMSINEIFSTLGEEKFRELEELMILKYSKENNYVISCGGGVIKRKNNLLNLKTNGVIIHLTRNENKLVYSKNRPLTKNKNDYLKLKEERFEIYKSYQDYQIDNSTSIKRTIKKIKEAFYESINN